MHNPLESYLSQQGFVVLDGGLATELEAHGADLDHFLWSARLLSESPDLIRDVHHDYLVAGADVIATATYQASLGGFARAGFERDQALGLMRLSVDLALQARERFWSKDVNRSERLRPLIAASIGPYGACLHDGSEYHGDYRVARQALLDFHRPRMEFLAQTPADLFAFETIPSQEEAEVLLELLGEHPGKPAWLSFSCRDGQHVSHGERFADCAALADRSDQIVGVGINCTAPQYVSALLESARNVTTPLAVYPNSGEFWIAEQNRWAGQGCRAFPIRAWYERGARLIGGCCRTGPADIARMRAALRDLLAAQV
jgi:homocysteine S-methyltransferase